MKIAEKSFVSLSYTLTVDGNVVEKVEATQPLDFVYGMGMLLPKFEENVVGKVVGDKFTFTLTPEESYGEFMQEAIVDLPKNLFEVDGKIDEQILTVGNMLPMMDNDGNRLVGRVDSIGEDTVKMDFNHPMAGKTLNFEGEVVGVRESTEADLQQGGGCGSGCEDCNCDGSCDSDSDKESACGCGCGC